jgi:hypothetical protein
LRHEPRDDPVERETVVKADAGQVDEARDVHRGDVGEELDLDGTLARLHAGVVLAFRVERNLLGPGQARPPLGVGLVDLRFRDLLIDLFDGTSSFMRADS